MSQFKNTNWWSLSLDNLFFLRVRSIIFFVIYPHCMNVHKTKVTRSRPRRYNLQDRDETRRSKKHLETASRPRHSRPRLHPWLSLIGSPLRAFQWAYGEQRTLSLSPPLQDGLTNANWQFFRIKVDLSCKRSMLLVFWHRRRLMQSIV